MSGWVIIQYGMITWACLVTLVLFFLTRVKKRRREGDMLSFDLLKEIDQHRQNEDDRWWFFC